MPKTLIDLKKEIKALKKIRFSSKKAKIPNNEIPKHEILFNKYIKNISIK